MVAIAYAENPVKKYQDIYLLNFDHDPDGQIVALKGKNQAWRHPDPDQPLGSPRHD